jgi:predicted DCC family thiol-disulfide oxidoreductase YuxK
MSPVPATILFDGVCNLCNFIVQFIIRRDARGYFRFASLQSAAGQALLAAHGLPLPAAAPLPPDSVLLVEDGRIYSHSTAVLRISRHLDGGWKWLAAAEVLPRFLRDAGYRWVARNRYRWFGRQESCMLPTPALQARFLA